MIDVNSTFYHKTGGTWFKSGTDVYAELMLKVTENKDVVVIPRK